MTGLSVGLDISLVCDFEYTTRHTARVPITRIPPNQARCLWFGIAYIKIPRLSGREAHLNGADEEHTEWAKGRGTLNGPRGGAQASEFASELASELASPFGPTPLRHTELVHVPCRMGFAAQAGAPRGGLGSETRLQNWR